MLPGRSQARRNIQSGGSSATRAPGRGRGRGRRTKADLTSLWRFTQPGFGPPTHPPPLRKASLLCPGAYLRHRSAEPRIVRALRDLQRAFPELRVLPAPVKQVHRPTAVDAAVPPRPRREAAGIAGALRCHTGEGWRGGGEEGKRTPCTGLGRASWRGRFPPARERVRARACVPPSAPAAAARGLGPDAQHLPRLRLRLRPGRATREPIQTLSCRGARRHFRGPRAEAGTRCARLGVGSLRPPPPTRAWGAVGPEREQGRRRRGWLRRRKRAAGGDPASPAGRGAGRGFARLSPPPPSPRPRPPGPHAHLRGTGRRGGRDGDGRAAGKAPPGASGAHAGGRLAGASPPGEEEGDLCWLRLERPGSSFSARSPCGLFQGAMDAVAGSVGVTRVVPTRPTRWPGRFARRVRFPRGRGWVLVGGGGDKETKLGLEEEPRP